MYVLMCTVFWDSPRSVRDVAIPAELQEAPGFRGASVLVNERSSKTALITWWESIEAMKNASQLLAQKGGFTTAQEALRGTVAWVDDYRLVTQDLRFEASVSLDGSVRAKQEAGSGF